MTIVADLNLLMGL